MAIGARAKRMFEPPLVAVQNVGATTVLAPQISFFFLNGSLDRALLDAVFEMVFSFVRSASGFLRFYFLGPFMKAGWQILNRTQ